jgi:hypothetical protein
MRTHIQILPPPTWTPTRETAVMPVAPAWTAPAAMPTWTPAQAPAAPARPGNLDARQQAAILIAALFGSSLREFDLVALHGRVALVDLLLPARPDPRLAVALVDYGTATTAAGRAYRRLYDALQDPSGGEWFYRTVSDATATLAALLQPRLTPGEHRLFCEWWTLTSALPHETQPAWHRPHVRITR